MTRVFCVYLDWTLESVPRCFYVGKGNVSRVRQLKRNKKHTRIAAKYGLRREVVLETSVEEITFEVEKSLIAEHKTYFYENDFGCNFTRGGEGTSGHKQSDEARRKMSVWRTGRPGHRHTVETRKRMSEAKLGRPPNNKGKCMSDATRAKMSTVRKGKPKSEEWKAKMRETLKRKKEQQCLSQ